MTAGKPKTFSKTADSGGHIVSSFCGDCGSTLFRETPTFAGARIIKVGVMDDTEALDAAKPMLELYAPNRVSWVKPIEGADQKNSMS